MRGVRSNALVGRYCRTRTHGVIVGHRDAGLLQVQKSKVLEYTTASRIPKGAPGMKPRHWQDKILQHNPSWLTEIFLRVYCMLPTDSDGL